MDQILDSSDATAVAALVNTGEIHPRELTERSVKRCEQRNHALNALVATRYAEALDDAEHVERSLPFAGVPFVVKDLGAAVTGLPHTRGSRLWADDIAQEDTELVKRYRAAGFIVLGVTNAPELGRSASTEPLLHGPCHNPHDLSRSTGGSSGGTAAAVAAGMVPIGHGNDGGGSIRIPASACGLVGLKPSRARTPSAPSLSLLAYPMGVNHVLTRSVRDTARVLDLTAGPMQGDPYQIAPPTRPWTDELVASPTPQRIAVCSTQRDGQPCDPEVAAAVEHTAALLVEQGHMVTVAGPDYPLEQMTEVMRTLMGVPLALQVNRRLTVLGRELRDEDLEPFTRLMYDAAGSVSGEQVLRAMELVEEVALHIGRFFADYDVLITPTYPAQTPPLGLLDTTNIDAMIKHAGTYASLTSPYNTTGQPAISLPLGTAADGMPIGVQLVADFGREDILIALSAQLEKAAPWSISPVWPTP
ncbi:MAG: amidase [Acidobacteria bacterium]|nr:amidase [Acidobacteriota bacterium]